MTRRHERQTDRPEADAKKEALLPPAALARDTAINRRFESVLKKQRELDKKVDEIYSLLMGASPSGRPDPKGKGGVGTALHETATHMGVLACNSELTAEGMKTLPKQVAREVVDKLLALFQESIDSLKAKDKELTSRLDDLTGDVKELHGMIVP